MSLPKYVPRTLSSEPSGFGKVERIKWLTGSTLEERVLVRAAQVQHFYALRIRAQVETSKIVNRLAAAKGADPSTLKPPLQELADARKVSLVRLQRMLRGEVVMHIDDLAWADVVLGPVSEIARADQQRKDANLQIGIDKRVVATGRARGIA
jgi:hypothetical protein